MFEGLTPEEVVAEAADRINVTSSKVGVLTDEEIMDLVRPIFHLYDLKDYESAMMVWAVLQKSSNLLFACHAYIGEVMIICAHLGAKVRTDPVDPKGVVHIRTTPYPTHKDFDWSTEGLIAIKDAYVKANEQRPTKPVVDFNKN